MLSCYVVTSLVSHWLRHHALNAGGPGSIPGQGTRFHMPQLRPNTVKYFLRNATLTQHRAGPEVLVRLTKSVHIHLLCMMPYRSITMKSVSLPLNPKNPTRTILPPGAKVRVHQLQLGVCAQSREPFQIVVYYPQKSGRNFISLMSDRYILSTKYVGKTQFLKVRRIYITM